MDPFRILVVDDDPEMTVTIVDALSSSGYRCETANSGASALALSRRLDFDAVVSDVRMAGMDGVELMSRLRGVQRDLPVVLVTGQGTISGAVEAIKRGAFQYVTKPFDPASLRALLAEALAARGKVARAPGQRAFPSGTEELVGSSVAMRELRAEIELVARSVAPALITGETGSGKELVARAIHACSPRRHRPFVSVNASAIPEALLESEMFGHARGAFTGAASAHRGVFQEADGGTLLLDEIGDMPVTLQVKLLRVLQEGEIRPVGAERPFHVDVRVLAATHQPLEELVRTGRFREDLYYRLNVVPVRVPPLRMRREDLPELSACLLARARARAPGSPAASISADLAAVFAAAPWPGNVRELESTIERLVVLAREPELRSDHAAQLPGLLSAPVSSEAASVEHLIQAHVEATLRQTAGNKVEAARLLGIDLSTLYRWQRKWRV